MIISKVENLTFEMIQGDDKYDYTEVVFDSRKVCDGCLFICLKGLRFDSHDVIDDVVRNGAKGIIIEHDCRYPENVNVYKVKNARSALSLCSAARFDYPAKKLTTIAVTGTKGKTTTACMIKTIIEKSGKSCGIIGTLGIEIMGKNTPTLNTTPESYDIQKAFAEMVDAGCEYVVMEASSQAFLMHRVDGVIYDYALFTNISNDHIGEGEHKDFEDYLNCKTQLFNQCRHGFVNIDDEHAGYIMVNGACTDIKTFGTSPKADAWYDNIRFAQDESFMGLEMDVHFKTEKLDCRISLPGEFNAPNAMGAFIVCDALGIDHALLETGLSDIHVNGRMELVYSTKDLKVLVDFAHNEISTVSIVETLKNYEHKRLVIVFGCGGNRSPERRYGMGRVVGENADFAIITEDNNRLEPIEDIMRDIHSTFDKTGCAYVDIPLRADAVRYAIEHHQPGDMVAIIGKGHEDYIDKGGVRTHYTDQEAVYEALEKLGLR